MNEQISLFEDVQGAEISVATQSEYNRTKCEGYAGYMPPIKSIHEGYGYAAEKHMELSLATKRLKSSTDTFLGYLSDNTGHLENIITSMYGYAQEVAKNAVSLSATLKRIMEEVEYGEPLPDEAYGIEDDNIEFEETETE